VTAYVANDRPEPLQATLRIALYRDFEVLVAEAERPVDLPGHAECAANVEQLLGWFADVSWAYRFGPPAQNLIVLSLERQRGQTTELLSQAVRMPVGRPHRVLSSEQLGVSASLAEGGEETQLTLSARHFVYAVRVEIPGFVSSDDGFSLEPGHERQVRLTRIGADSVAQGSLSAVNMSGRVRIDSQR
jgi:beta-mannosidase